MSKFLVELAEKLLDKYGDEIGECTIVFPNRRAGLFLRKYLSSNLEKPIWSPNIFSMEDYFLQFSDIQKSDPLSLIFELYRSFKQFQPTDEGFEKFYFWGEMLLRDFQEVDHYLVDPKQLFKYIKDDRQIAQDFDFLADQPEQVAIIKQFWENFFPETTTSQSQFLETWKILLPVYEHFSKEILNQKIGHTSFIYRHIYESLQGKTLNIAPKPIIFAGLNALTPVEEKLVKHFIIHHQAEVYWDVDAYYVKDEKQEAGLFFRAYQKDVQFGKTFPKELPTNFNKPKEIKGMGVSLEVGQTKLMGQQIDELIRKTNVPQEEIVVVLPQDYMLFPTLNALPSAVSKVNVTMGYPLKDTPIYSLLELCLDLQEKSNTDDLATDFYHKHVIDILRHPYLFQESTTSAIEEFIGNIKKNNQTRIALQDIQSVDFPCKKEIFRTLGEHENLAFYLKSVVVALTNWTVDRFGLEQQFLNQYKQMLTRLCDILDKQEEKIDIKIFKSLFSKASRTVKVPFSGEPVLGLQVMGALETRNLDFQYVFFLGLNEKTYPAPPRQGSFVPFRIRKAFQLPTYDMQDAIYAYIFYRLLQRCTSFRFYFNTHSAFGLSGETSRFVKQLEWESNHAVEYFTLGGEVKIKEEQWLSVDTTPEIVEKLKYYYCEGGRTKLSPSAISMYMDCRLHFYFRYVLRLFEADKISDQLQARDFGNILHESLEILYKDLAKKKGERTVLESDFYGLKNGILGALKMAFKSYHNLNDMQKVVFKGRNVVLVEIMEQFLSKVLAIDEQYAPFTIFSLESEKSGDYSRLFPINVNGEQVNVALKGIVDRVDEKEGVVRVIDYKTGSDKTDFKSIASLFDPENKTRNKAAFQTIYYAWLYVNKHGDDKPVIPCVFNIQEMFAKDFDPRLKMDGKPISDIRPHLPVFEKHFTELIQEIFDLKKPFDHIDDDSKCKWMGFENMCKA